MPRLTITDGPLAGRQYSFDDTVTVGRGAYCDVRLDDSTVSRRHAQIRRSDDGNWHIVDLGSANGTTSNGRPIGGEVALPAGTALVFGEVPARFETAAAEAPKASPRMLEAWMARHEGLAALVALPARREDPARLLNQALTRVLDLFPTSARVSLYATRAGTTRLVLANEQVRETLSVDLRATLAEASLRHVDGLAGDGEVFNRAGVAGVASALAMPVVFAGETLGALVVESAREGCFSEDDRGVGKAIAATLAGLVDTRRSQHPERRLAERDLVLARRIQQHFLPQNTLSVDGWSIAEAYEPARAVGGDHYDWFQYADGRLGMVIADVSGKAVSAALVMARFGMALRLIAGQAPDPASLLVSLNILLLDELEPGMFVTAQALALDPLGGHIELANAGHPPPLVRRHDGTVLPLAVDEAAALGVDGRMSFRSTRFELGNGDALLLHTDGLEEAQDADGNLLGLDPVSAILATTRGAAAIVQAIQQTVSSHAGASDPADDLTLIVLERAGG